MLLGYRVLAQCFSIYNLPHIYPLHPFLPFPLLTALTKCVLVCAISHTFNLITLLCKVTPV